MSVGKVGLALLIWGSGAVSSEIDVHLFDQTSTIVVARNEGTVAEKLLDINQLVQSGEEILILYHGQERQSVTAPSDGLLKDYAQAIRVGADVQKGDVIAVLVNDEVKGALVSKEGDAFPHLLSTQSTYCCLNAGDTDFNIQILDIKKVGKVTWFYFSILDGPAFLSLIQDNTAANPNVRFEFVEKIAPSQNMLSKK
ncbi:hypothetical protein [Aliiglaciecola litoralis]|uniref:HlyD family secretion protein n=1 Tax=Aliiglaciecola litoralis TaxID=582857 RepID=A0ABN1LF85_9ALTE